jgi:hypothetical protein
LKTARRTFILGAGLFAASPVLANLLTPTNGKASALPPSAPAALPPLPPATAADGTDLVFKIDGWSLREAVAPDGASMTHSSTRGPASNEAWLVVNKSWRTAWR